MSTYRVTLTRIVRHVVADSEDEAIIAAAEIATIDGDFDASVEKEEDDERNGPDQDQPGT